jgi:TIR domain-containing protein
MSRRIFLSYRQKDSAAQAGRVTDRLHRDFGQGCSFLDVDSIPLGVNFVKHLTAAVSTCEVLLAVIGPQWLDARDERNGRRLEDPNDFVRIEIGAALQRDIPVIPILFEGATVPRPEELPEDIRELAFRNGISVRHSSFHSDMDRLVSSLKLLLDTRQPESTQLQIPSQPPQAAPSAPIVFERRQAAEEAATKRVVDKEESRKKGVPWIWVDIAKWSATLIMLLVLSVAWFGRQQEDQRQAAKLEEERANKKAAAAETTSAETSRPPSNEQVPLTKRLSPALEGEIANKKAAAAETSSAETRRPPTIEPEPVTTSRVVMYDSEPNNKQAVYVGVVSWRTGTASDGRTTDFKVIADIEVPSRQLAMTMTIRRVSKYYPPTYQVELDFQLPAKFSGGVVRNVSDILMRPGEQMSGQILTGIAEGATGSFVFQLSNIEPDRSLNLQLLKERPWFEVALTYPNNLWASLLIEKGAKGERAFKDAFASWGD